MSRPSPIFRRSPSRHVQNALTSTPTSAHPRPSPRPSPVKSSVTSATTRAAVTTPDGAKDAAAGDGAGGRGAASSARAKPGRLTLSSALSSPPMTRSRAAAVTASAGFHPFNHDVISPCLLCMWRSNICLLQQAQYQASRESQKLLLDPQAPRALRRLGLSIVQQLRRSDLPVMLQSAHQRSPRHRRRWRPLDPDKVRARDGQLLPLIITQVPSPALPVVTGNLHSRGPGALVVPMPSRPFQRLMVVVATAVVPAVAVVIRVEVAANSALL